MANTELAKPEWAPLDEPTAFNMSPESIGYYLFTEYSYLLEGRLRPVTIFDQRPISLYSQGLWKEAEKHRLSTIGEVLRLPQDKFTLTFSDDFERGLRDYVDGLAIPPHARLVNAVFGQDHYSTHFPPALEQEFIQTVEDQLDTLRAPRRKAVLVCRYGLDDGINRTLTKTAAIFNLSREWIRQIEANAIRRLRHPSRAKYLEMFMPFPEASLGRAVFGPRLRRYLPQMHGLQVSDSLGAELQRYGVPVGYSLSYQLEKPADPFQLENISAIAICLDYALNNPPTQDTAGETEQEQWRNNLLPQLPITSEQLAAIGSLQLSEVGLPIVLVNAFARAAKKTFADILEMSPVKFAKIKQLGEKGAFLFGMKLGELLQLPPNQYPNEDIGHILEHFVKELKHSAEDR